MSFKKHPYSLLILLGTSCVPSPQADVASMTDAQDEKRQDDVFRDATLLEHDSASDVHAVDARSEIDAGVPPRLDVVDEQWDATPTQDSANGCGDGRGVIVNDACLSIPGAYVPCNRVTVIDARTDQRIANATVIIGFEMGLPQVNGTYTSILSCSGEYWLRVRHPGYLDFDQLVRASVDRPGMNNVITDEWILRIAPTSDAGVDSSPDVR